METSTAALRQRATRLTWFTVGWDAIEGIVAVTAGLLAGSIAALAAWRGMIHRGIASGLIVGGAVANLADRIIDGSVIDMFDLGWWAAFNVADVCIVVGVGLLLLQSFRQAGPIAQGQSS